MQLVINTRESYLRKNGNCFLVKTDDKVFEVSANKVESIFITTSAYISTDAIKFAVEKNIDIVFLDFYGNPYGRVWHSKLGSTTLIRRRQLEIYGRKEADPLIQGLKQRILQRTDARGFEPPIYGLGGRRLIHWATRPFDPTNR